jgi:ankyrin repeat protein
MRAKYGENRRALLRAALIGDTRNVLAVVAEGVDIDATDTRGRTALMNAAMRGHTDTVTALLDTGADIDAKDEKGLTALMYAVKEEHLLTVETLLNRGADVNAKGKYGGYAPIVFAVRVNNAELVELLLMYGVDAKTFDASLALGVAQLKGDVRIIKSLRRAGLNRLSE